MQTFLAIIGGIVLAIIGLLVLGLIVLRWKLRRFVHQFGGMSDMVGASGHVVPPMRIRLRPDNSYAWRDEIQVDSVGDELAGCGFVRIGTFSSTPPTVPIEAWHDPQQSIYAAICEHPVAGVWLDVLSLGQDGSTYTVSSGPGDQFDRPSDFQLERIPGATPKEVVSRFLGTRPDRAAVRTSAETFPAVFEDLWQRSMEFRIEQGVPSEEELRRICSAEGEAPPHEMVEQFREMWQLQINEVRERQIREAFLEDSKLTALEWDRMHDRVVFVHDDLPADELASMIEIDCEDSLSDDEIDDAYESVEERARELLQDLSARKAFSKMNSEQDSAVQFRNIGKVARPIAADVYVGPEDLDV